MMTSPFMHMTLFDLSFNSSRHIRWPQVECCSTEEDFSFEKTAIFEACRFPPQTSDQRRVREYVSDAAVDTLDMDSKSALHINLVVIKSISVPFDFAVQDGSSI